MDFFKMAIAFQILLFIYFEGTTLVNLYPWNDLSKYSNQEKIIEASVNGIIIILCLGLFISEIKWLMIISVIFWFVWIQMPFRSGNEKPIHHSIAIFFGQFE